MPNSGNSNPKLGNDLVILPSGEFVKWNDWTQTEPAIQPQKPLPVSPEYDALVDFFFPRGPQPEPGTTADLWRREGRCPICGELGRIHMSTMVCSKHGPYT